MMIITIYRKSYHDLESFFIRVKVDLIEEEMEEQF